MSVGEKKSSWRSANSRSSSPCERLDVSRQPPLDAFNAPNVLGNTFESVHESSIIIFLDIYFLALNEAHSNSNDNCLSVTIQWVICLAFWVGELVECTTLLL